MIEMPYLKIVFDHVISFLYSGKMEFGDLSLAELLQLETLVRLMMLEAASEATSQYIAHSTTHSGFTLAETIKAMDLTYVYALDTSKQNLLRFLNENLRETCQLSEFLQLPVWIMKDLMLKTSGSLPYDRLSALVCWLEEEGNAMEPEDITTIRDTFHLSHFSTKDILGLVRKSNIFSQDLIIEALSNVIKTKDESLAVMTATDFGLPQ